MKEIKKLIEEKTLELAIDKLLKAVLYEFDIGLQKKLLSAASFGKNFLQHFNNNKIYEASKRLRILNEVRNKKIGFPITNFQFERLKSKGTNIF
jgi:hypothetical protein